MHANNEKQAKIEALRAENLVLRTKNIALDAHVRRLHIIIGKRYTTNTLSLWNSAAEYARKHGGTVQEALHLVPRT